MKYLLHVVLALTALSAISFAQDLKPQSIYEPFTVEQVQEVMVPSQPPKTNEITFEQPMHKKHHKKGKHGRPEQFQRPMYFEDEEQTDELTQEQKQDRKRERKRFNKIFRVGLIVGVAAIAVILFKFCKAKRSRRMRQMPVENQFQGQQPYVLNTFAYPRPAPIQMHPKPHRQLPPQPQAPPQPIVRGRVHDSVIKQVQVPSLEAQINFHQNEILRLRQMKRQQYEMARVSLPINTTESFDTQYPINNRYRNIPVGQPIQPIYPKDANSSFASEYPEI